MQRIVRWCLKNKSVVILATILLIGSGVYATTRLNQELLPDISFPIITISTPVAGAGPDLVDEQVTQPVEDAINGVDRVGPVHLLAGVLRRGRRVRPRRRHRGGRVRPPGGPRRHTASFAGRRSRGQEPVGFAVPILSLSLAAEDQDLADLTSYAEDEVVPSIEEVDGVASVDLIGGAEKRIQVDLDPDKIKEKASRPTPWSAR